MGSRHHSLEMTEVRDAITIIQNFQDHSGVKVALAFSVVDVGKVPTLMGTASAFELRGFVLDPTPLASVNVTSSATNLRFFKDVVTHLLYLLDGQLALREMQGGEK